MAAGGAGARAPLIEIFSSIQGEGRHVGRSMVFVRVAVCPIRCGYCDTPNSYRAPPRFPVTIGAARSDEDNPVTSARAAVIAAAAASKGRFGATNQVSLTGGEPLLYADFVAEFGAELARRGLRLFLETAALDAGALAECLPVVSHLSADYKLPGTLLEGDEVVAGEQCVACVARAVEAGVSVDVKMVLTADVTEVALAAALARLHPLRRGFELVLQPVTPFGAVDYPCPPDHLARLVSLAADAGFAPRVLPQTHKLLGVD